MDAEQYEVIIVGSGAAGLMAALELSLAGKKTAVIEARDYIGGRAASLHPGQFKKPVEAGAEFIHGNLELTTRFLEKAGISYHKVDGELWQKTDGKWEEQDDFVEDFAALNKKLKSLRQDISVRAFIDQYLQGSEFDDARFTLQNYVEGYYAAETARASSFALRDDLNKSDEEQYRIDGGYAKLFDYLYRQCIQNGVRFYFSEPVKEINWTKGLVSVVTAKSKYRALKILVTVPLGVIQSKAIRISPAVGNHENAALYLGFGGVIKTILQFSHPFWKNREITGQHNLEKLGFVFSSAVIPTWWTRYPENEPLLIGWCAGPHADELKDLGEHEILEKAIKALSEIFDASEEFFTRNLTGWHVANWVKDPYCLGGYSYEVVNGEAAKKQLLLPVENTLWFSGEALYEGIDTGTVNAALQMGRNSAHQIIASFKS